MAIRLTQSAADKLGAKKPATRHKKAANAAKKIGQTRRDKAPIFLHYWKLLLPDMPWPHAEHFFHHTRGWRFDYAFETPLPKVAVEVDGGQFTHGGGRHATDADRDKMNHAAALGWRVFHFSPQQLEADPQGCVDLVRRALGL